MTQTAPDKSIRSEGEKAAYGKRNAFVGRVRSKAFAAFRKFEESTHSGKRMTADFLEVVPPVRNAAELADISGRMNWYFPAPARGVPLTMKFDRAKPFDSADAWYLDPELVTDASWAPRESQQGRGHLLVRKLTPATAWQYLLHYRSATLIDHEIGFGVEDGYFRLIKRFGFAPVPTPAESVQRLLQRRVEGGTALVLATGPSAQELTPADVSADVRVTCNSAVRDHELISVLKPDVIAFGDPVFHYGPSRYAAAFRRDLLHAIEVSDAVILTTQLFAEPLLANVPEIADRVAVLPIVKRDDWVWPSTKDPSARITSNVLTNLMLPAAFALADHVQIAGCDGRDPSENYFWKHNTATQYSDDMMRAAFEAHQAFFRDRDYGDYYQQHCDQLEEFLATAEAAGKTATGVTSSHIPALLKRNAPRFVEDPEAPLATDGRDIKFCLVGSSGGHLSQLVALKPLFEQHDRSWVTFDKEDARSLLAGERMYACAFPTNRNIPNLIRNVRLAFTVLWRERPDVIISTGAAVAIPFFVLGRLFGAKLIYLEVFDRIDSPTVTGRICQRFAHVFALQWEEQRTHYRRGVVVGPVL